ncbi:DNA-binding response regulator [Planctobacterium marinum]|uniref:DNA-binding response regulator n=2 Tax=Planctobacterium marinum TaxID=1631968 RepID=A0AA48HUL7_9ALTE|nr:DNA-binding response regulator [Planctobacterium marinum]
MLIVEDDQPLAELTRDFFEQFEFDCTIEENGVRAVELALANPPDIILLDIMLPELDGIQICKQIRDKISAKIVMLTARTDTIDQVLGLEIGADDYVSKPVEPRLLLAKVRAVLRRDNSPVASQQEEFSFADFTLCPHKRELNKNGQPIELSTHEYDLLLMLVQNKGQVISREAIFQHLRGVEYDGQNRQADILISTLRAKIESAPNAANLIKTIRSRGYLFTG